MDDTTIIDLNDEKLKLYAAMEHLKNAINLFFNDDIESALVLAGAAEEMIGFFAAEFSEDKMNSFRELNNAVNALHKVLFVPEKIPNRKKKKGKKRNVIKAGYSERKHLDDLNQLYLRLDSVEEINLIFDRVIHDFTLVDGFIRNNFTYSEYYTKQRNILVNRLNYYENHAS